MAAAACVAAPAFAVPTLAQTNPVGGTVDTAVDETDEDSTLSFREALDALHPGGTGVRFDVPLFADPNVTPVIELNGAIPAGREDVFVDLEQGGRGIELLVKPNGNAQSAAGPHALNPTFTGSGTIAVDLGSGSAAELTLNGHNGHGLTRVISGVAVAGTDTGFGRGLHLEAGAAGRLTGDSYLGQLTGDGTLNLGAHRLVLGIFPANPGRGSAADGPGYSSAFAGSLAGTDTAGLLKLGTGTVSLTGASTYGGGTSILAGVLEVGSAESLGTGDVQIGNGAELRLLGVLDDRPGHAAGPAFLREISLIDGGGRIDLNGHDLLLGGRVTGAGGLYVHGGAELTLGVENTFQGGVAVEDATLVVAAAGALGGGDVYLNDATLRTAHTSGSLTYAGGVAIGEDGGTIETTGGAWVISKGTAGGALTKTGAGQLWLVSAGTHSSTTVTGGTVAAATLSALGSGTLTLDGGELFAPLASGEDSVLANAVALGAGGGTIRTTSRNLTHDGRLSGAGLLTKAGSGVLIVQGTNAATGGFLVTGGALRADRQSALGIGPLTLAGGSFFTGGQVTLGENGFAAAAAGGALRTIDADDRITLGGDVDLQGNLALNGGGTFVFAPDAATFNSASGVVATAANGSTVRVDTVAPSLDLAADTRLTGLGEVLGDVTTAGRIAPGADGVGGQTLDVAGDLTLRSGSELVVDHTPGGTDSLVVGGAANLSGGAVTVNVGGGNAAQRRALATQIAQPGSSMDLTVLTAAGGVTGGPRDVNVSSWSLTGTASTVAGGGGDALEVRLSRVANGAAVFANAEDAAAADALFTLMPNAEGPAADLFAAALLSDAQGAQSVFNGLTAARSGGLGGVSRAGAGAVRRTAFRALRPGSAGGGLFRGQNADSLSGANGGGANDEFGFGSFALATDIGNEESDDVDTGVRNADAGDSDSDSGVKQASFTPGARAARSRRGGRELPWGGFAEGYVVGGEVGSGVSETEYLSGGAVFGFDRLVAPGAKIGVLFGVGGTGAENDGGAEKFEADVDSWQIGLYGTKTAGRWHGAAAAVYGGDSYETTRSVTAGGQRFTANGDTDGSTVTLAAETGYLLPIEWMDLQPLAGIQYVHSARDGYTETGLGAADLQYGDASGDSLRLQLGARAAKTLGDVGSFAVIPELRAWWFGEVSGSDSAAPVRFAAAPTLPAFSTVGDDPANQWVLGGGLTGLLGRHVRLYAHYDLLLGEDSLSHAGTGGAELRW
ncbi:hypothetical protein LzC2_08960 [Planctomycetes bacterium LzC2]|uniref:Autotransporter domain-containing protein n=1 Tax=Alienimonas chondri TaxID=2681879 RepID=A0ABX1VAA1_9PLAN|nr:hypothetical protein [Alienimonas chondri]